MGEITWDYLSMRQQETLQDIVLGNGAFVFDPAMYKLCEQLEGYGLVEILNNEDGWFEVDPTDKGRGVYAQKPAPATAQPAADAGGAGDDDSADDNAEPIELSIQRFIPGLWRVTHKDGVASMELVVEDATDPQAEIQKFIDKGLKIDAVRLHRKLYDSDLNTARDAVLAMAESGSVFDGIERRIMKAGDVRFLEGIDESMGIETARYINNHSIALHNANKVAEALAGDVDRLARELASVQAQRDAAVAVLEPFVAVYTRYTAHCAKKGLGALSFIEFISEYEGTSDEFISPYQDALLALASKEATK